MMSKLIIALNFLIVTGLLCYYYVDENATRTILGTNVTTNRGEPPLELSSSNVKKKEANLIKNPHNPYGLNLTVPEKMPLITINPADFQESDFGGATIDMFQGEWVPIIDKYSNYDHHMNNFCPFHRATDGKYENHCRNRVIQREMKQYVANGLKPFNASLFMNLFEKHGPIVFAGDSLTIQMEGGLKCMIENQLGPGKELGIVTEIRPIVYPTLKRMETIDVRLTLLGMGFFDTEFKWVDDAIKANSSYVVYNTGAWWSPTNLFHARGDWCEFKNWLFLDQEDMAVIFEETLREVLLPQLKRLVDNGVTPIWRDTSPAGIFNEAVGDIDFESGHVQDTPEARKQYMEFSSGWRLHPVYNRVGRRITQEVGGLILPIFDLSMARSEDHIGPDNGDVLTGDQLHWCSNSSPHNVPNVWNQLLQAVIFDENGEATRGRSLLENDGEDKISIPFADYDYENFNINHTFSTSGESLCPCSDAKDFGHCFSNIKCQWINTNQSCVEAKQPRSPIPNLDDFATLV